MQIPALASVAGATGALLGGTVYTMANGVRPHFLYAGGGGSQERYPASDELVRAWANTRGEVRWFASSPPTGARPVRILDRVRTPLGNPRARDNGAVNGMRAAFLNDVRYLLSQNGMADWDARIACELFANETRWGLYCWNRNMGNVKTGSTVSSQDGTNRVERIVGSRQVYCTNFEAEGIYLLRDRGGSLDSYPSYSDWGPSMSRWKALIERHYPGFKEGSIRGGLEGALLAARTLGGENPGRLKYSSRGALARELDMRGYWASTERRIGPLFVR